MIFSIPLRDLTLLTGESPDILYGDDVVARIRANHPALFAGASVSVAEDMVSIEVPEPASASKAEAARLLEKGVRRSGQGDYRKAAGILARVLELDPANGPACRNLGMVLIELGETEKARRYLVESALHDPTDPWPYVVFANVLVREPGKLEPAERLLRKAHELAPDDPSAMNSLGGIATERGDLAGAMDWFQKALAVNPDFANAHFGLANALAAEGRLDEARSRLHLLFRTAEMRDVRSQAVFGAARELWRDVTQQLGTSRRDESLADVRTYLAAIAQRSGFPAKEEWSDLPENFAARTEMAWKTGRDHHLICLRRDYPEPAWHHILAREATHIALEADARAVGRNRWFGTTAETRAKAIRLMAPEIRKLERQGHSEKRVAELLVQLHNGATVFVFDCAIDMVIEERLRRELPALADAQLLSLDKLAQEAIGATFNQEIRKLTPQRIQSVNDTLNAATALFVRDLSDGAIDHVAAYEPFHCLQQAESLYAAYLKAAARNIGPGEECDLVDEFAAQLGVRAWYVWRPDTGAGQEATL